VLKWSGSLLCLVLAAAFVFSTRRALTWDSPDLRYELSLLPGTVTYGWRPEGWRLADERYPPRPGWAVASYGWPTPVSWWIGMWTSKHSLGVSFPLWIPFVVIFFPTAALWYVDRRYTSKAWSRLLTWLTPNRPKKVTFWLVLAFCPLHVVALFAGWSAVYDAYNFLVDYRPVDPVYAAIDLSLPILFLSTPLWAILWAWIWTRVRNRLFRRQPGYRCLACGYDLTGNVSGRCPECGNLIAEGAT
jgi:hypothetical protein